MNTDVIMVGVILNRFRQFLNKCIMDNNMKEQFKSTEKLYHYTSFDSACKILSSMTLRFGAIHELNDPQEAKRAIFTELHADQLQWNNLRNRFRQLSLSQDDSIPGFRIQSMWSHYADRSNGVCLVFDKKKLLGKFDDKQYVWHGKINYIDSHTGDLILGSDTNLFNRLKDVFFKKDKSWASEQEYRIVSYSSDITQVDISDSLMGVILYASPEDVRQNMADAKALASILGDENKLWELGNFLDEYNIRTKDGETVWTTKPSMEEYSLDI